MKLCSVISPTESITADIQIGNQSVLQLEMVAAKLRRISTQSSYAYLEIHNPLLCILMFLVLLILYAGGET